MAQSLPVQLPQFSKEALRCLSSTVRAPWNILRKQLRSLLPGR